MRNIPLYLTDAERKERSSRRRIAWFLLGGIAGLCAMFVAWVLLESPVFSLRTVSVAGNSRVPSSTVADALYAQMSRGGWFAGLVGPRNMLAVPRAFDARTMALLPLVASADISRSYAEREVTVTVRERTPEGVWCASSPPASPAVGEVQGPECFWFDQSGVLFARAPDAEGSLVRTVHDYTGRELHLFSEALPAEFVANLLSVFDALDGAKVSAEEVRVSNLGAEEADVLTYRGTALYFSLRFPAADDVAVLQKLLRASGTPPGYVDFRVENRAYYK